MPRPALAARVVLHLSLIGLSVIGGPAALADPPPPDPRAAFLARLADDPTDPEALLGLADLHEKEGRENAARRYLRAFLRMTYGHPRRVEAANRLAALRPKDPFVLVSDDYQERGFAVYRNAIDEALAVRVPAGPYRRHVEREDETVETVEVDLPDYLIDLHEATHAAHEWFLWEGGFAVAAFFGPDAAEWLARDDEQPHWRCLERGAPDWDRPCWGPTFFEARARARWASKRVPTEAEWEKAARGGIRLRGGDEPLKNPFPDRRYPWGDAPPVAPDGTSRANIDDAVPRDDSAGEDRSLPVDSLPTGASPYGCLHMAGNASEWNDDPWLEDEALLLLPRVSPDASAKGAWTPKATARPVRGGYFNDGDYRAAIDSRDERTADYSGMSYLFKTGLRCAGDAPPRAPAGEATEAPDVGPLHDEPDPLDARRLFLAAGEAEEKGDAVRAYRIARGAARLVRDGPMRARLVRWLVDLRPADPWVAAGGAGFRNAIDGKAAVRSAGLLVDVLETTDADMLRFAAEGGYEERSYWTDEGWASRPQGPEVNVQRWGSGDLPATRMTFHEAQAYARWARKRLPIAVEWDRIAGAGVRKYPWGDAPVLGNPPRVACQETVPAADAASSREDVRVPVGSFPHGATPEGVVDLWGSVAEWVDGAPERWPSLRALKGGCVITDTEDFDGDVTRYDEPGSFEGRSAVEYGFRCVADPPR